MVSKQKLTSNELILARLTAPFLLVLLILMNSFVFSAASISHTNSLKAFFQVTNNTEWVTIYLILMWLYILITPNILYYYYRPDRTTNSIQVVDKQNIIQLKTDKDAVPIVLKPGAYDYTGLIKEMNNILNPHKILFSCNTTTQKFEFASNLMFSFEKDSPLLNLLGFRTRNSYDASSTSPLDKYTITDAACHVYVLSADDPTQLHIDEKLNVLDPRNLVQSRTIVVAVFFFMIIIWKYFSVRSFRYVGKNIRSEIINDEQLHILSTTRNFYNNIAIFLAICMLVWIMFLTITNQDLNPKLDIKFG